MLLIATHERVCAGVESADGHSCSVALAGKTLELYLGWVAEAGVQLAEEQGRREGPLRSHSHP